ncbi:abortive infection family protein [Leisingera sp. M523]|uniref:abortive infection family protein n=1 Tax=Leisingera sp. M523 TaxID=2867013 RepID=UPI0021A74750|nr:abortive infection family protein [Leisingera sp. M523]UWQ30029.1 abortive infection family protein [Leisingera sp. M523]
MEGGYVLDFSNRTIEEHFEDEFGIEFYSYQYAANGNSKANRLRTILATLEGPKAALVLKNLWDVRNTLPLYGNAAEPSQEDKLRKAYFSIVGQLEGANPAIDLKAFENFDDSDTLHALLQSIERDIRDDAPEAAIDRLHLFCVKRFRHLLEVRQIASEKDEPLNSLVGKYKKALEAEGVISPMSLVFIRYSIAVFEKFNAIRNDRSLAHDNTLLDPREARFIFDAVGAVLRFIKGIDDDFGG